MKHPVAPEVAHCYSLMYSDNLIILIVFESVIKQERGMGLH